MKRCTGPCGKNKTLNEFGKSRPTKDGLNYFCRVCANAQAKAWRLAHPDKEREWRLSHPDKVRENMKKWRLAYPEKTRALNRKWYRDNREKFREKERKWYRANPEKVRAWGRAWKKNNPGKVAQIRLRDKTNRNLRIPKFGQEGIEEFYANCPEGYVVDHIIPLQGKKVSGLHNIFNLQYLTKYENGVKWNKFDGTVNNDSWREAA